MDTWQSHIYDDCKALVGEEFDHQEKELSISIGLREAYVIMKALEDQASYLALKASMQELR